jgi:hypothetical protein
MGCGNIRWWRDEMIPIAALQGTAEALMAKVAIGS